MAIDVGGNRSRSATERNRGQRRGTGFTTHFNPSFVLNDESSVSAAGPFAGPVLRGGIEQEYARENPKTRRMEKWGCKFLYNPSIITASYSTSTDVYPPEQIDPAAAGMFYSPHRTISFDILFDRTLEVWRARNAHANSSRGVPDGHMVTRGVLIDIMYLERTVGISQEGQPLALSPVRITVVPVISFVGFVSNMTVTYTHFTSNMVPTRCVVNLSILQAYGVPPGLEGTIDVVSGGQDRATTDHNFGTPPGDLNDIGTDNAPGGV